MFTQKFIKIFHSVQEIGLFSLFQNLNLGNTSAMPRPIPNDIWQSLGLHLVNINAYAKFYQNIPNGLELSTFFTNRSVTKSSQTVRWQNQMFDYRALCESQPSDSVDFLRVVQLHVHVCCFFSQESQVMKSVTQTSFQIKTSQEENITQQLQNLLWEDTRGQGRDGKHRRSDVQQHLESQPALLWKQSLMQQKPSPLQQKLSLLRFLYSLFPSLHQMRKM